MLLFNRPKAPRRSACQALKYYLDLTGEDADAIPAETRKLLDGKAAQCPDDELRKRWTNLHVTRVASPP
jgi:hypothetical protein